MSDREMRVDGSRNEVKVIKDEKDTYMMDGVIGEINIHKLNKIIRFEGRGKEEKGKKRRGRGRRIKD